MTLGLAERVAVVTGGSQGIGRAIAERLSQAGANVVIGDIRPPANHDLGWLELDVTSEASVASFLAAVTDRHRRLDVLVNNAGIMFEEELEQHSLDDWQRALAVNLTGPFLMAKHAAVHLRATAGVIVNIGSIEGFSCNPNHAAYAATKAGVHGLTTSLAVDLGPSGVRVNAIAPGWIDTNLNASYVDHHPERDAIIDELAGLHPIGRVGQPGDVGDVAVWLASDASRFVTGQIITVDGGRLSRPPLPGSMS